MKLRALLKELPTIQVKGSKEIFLTGITSNSKLVAPGNLFIAKKGGTFDGTDYVPQAIAAGASAVLTDLYDPSIKITQLIHPSVNEMEVKLVKKFYQDPSQELFMVGITGTNGKTTSSYMIRHLLSNEKEPCGLIGTIEYIIGNQRYQAIRTTPDLVANYKMLREMVQQKCHSAVMEVTSHALEQGRVAEIDYDVALFTNLTVDHLDYHHTMEEYCQAKNRLFRSLGKLHKKGHAIVNQDSPWKDKILDGCTVPVTSFAIDSPADLVASNLQFEGGISKFDLHYLGKQLNGLLPLSGRFNVYNCLGAIATGLVYGLSLESLVDKIATLPPIAGRLERVTNPLGLQIYVDFAHTGDALDNILSCLTEIKKGRLITVFGAGGDRDPLRRQTLAKASEKWSDFSIITSDNPRSEDPVSICKEVAQAFKPTSHFLVIVERRKAIEKAIEMANSNDIILIAGKGHEPYQIFATHSIHFSDKKVALDICSQKIAAGVTECTI